MSQITYFALSESSQELIRIGMFHYLIALAPANLEVKEVDCRFRKMKMIEKLGEYARRQQ